MSVPEGKVSEMRQTHESHRGWPPSWIGIVVSLTLGGCLLALGAGGNAPALAGWEPCDPIEDQVQVEVVQGSAGTGDRLAGQQV